jgi:protein transport protein SEC24
LNEVPVEYFCPLDENGRRRDADERPELSHGSVEFVAPTEYMVRPPMPPVYFFIIDVSSSAVKSGMVKVAADTIKECLDKLPGSPRTQIGFMTFDSSLHFYNLKSSLTQPQMMVVADLEDPFLPLPDDLLVNLSESRTVVEALVDSLPAMFENNQNVESALGPALKAASMVMSQLGGKLLLFQSTLPTLGFGRLKLRGDDPRLYGTDKEHHLRGTEDQFYKTMAADFSKFQIGCNIYAFSERYTDVASLGILAKYTGGQVCYYPAFQAQLHGEKFSYELARDLTRETAWEAVMRIRCGKGIRFSTYHGHFMLRSSDLMALPAVDCDKAFAMQLMLEDTLLTTQTVYFQVALLYTSSNGERRIRVHTLATPVVNELSELYRAADVGAIVSLMSKLAVEKTMQSKLEESRQATQQRLVRSLREYKNLFAVQNRTMNRLIYPESLKLLPLYTLGIIKSLALRGGFGDCTPDERSAMGYEIMTMSIPRLLKLLYPTLLRMDEYLMQGPQAGSESVLAELPSPLPLTMGNLDPRGAYLLFDGLRFVLWLGKVLPAEFVTDLLGPEAAYTADSSKIAIVQQENMASKRLISALDALQKTCPAVYQECTGVRQGEQPREGMLVLSNLVEDQMAGSSGYADFVVQIYRQVQQKS